MIGDKAAKFWIDLCNLPKEERDIFFEWAQKEIKNLDKKLQRRKKENGTQIWKKEQEDVPTSMANKSNRTA